MTNEENLSFETHPDITELHDKVNVLRNEIQKCLVGQENMTDLLLTALLANGHVLIEGVPGIAKTLAARLLAKTIDAGFSRLQFTPDLMPSDVLGTSVFHPASGSFVFRKGPIFSNIVLIDEINRAPAKTQSALFEVMEERQVSYDGTTYPFEFPFMVLATQNPVDHEGTYRLPEAQLDRFMFKILVNYPNAAEELKILELHHSGIHSAFKSVTAVITPAELEKYRKIIDSVHIEAKLQEYIVAIVQSTRNHPFIYIGASPRASLSLIYAAKALAAIRGKGFAVPEDIQELAYPVLRHRLVISPEKEMEGLTNDEVISQILRKIEVPR